MADPARPPTEEELRECYWAKERGAELLEGLRRIVAELEISDEGWFGGTEGESDERRRQ